MSITTTEPAISEDSSAKPAISGSEPSRTNPKGLKPPQFICENPVHQDVIRDLSWLVKSQASVTFDGDPATGKATVTVRLPDGRFVTTRSWRHSVWKLRP